MTWQCHWKGTQMNMVVLGQHTHRHWICFKHVHWYGHVPACEHRVMEFSSKIHTVIHLHALVGILEISQLVI